MENVYVTRRLSIVISILYSWKLQWKLDERSFKDPFLDFSPKLHCSKEDHGCASQRKWLEVKELGRSSLPSH